MVYQAMAQVNPLRPRNDLHQVTLDLLGRVFRGQPQPLCQALDVSVDHDSFRNTKRRAKYDIRRLAADPSQCGQCIQLARDFAIVTVDHLFGHRQEVASLGSKKTGRPDQGFEVAGEGHRETGGIGKTAEQLGGDHIDPSIRALGREDGRHQKLVGIGVSQGADGLGIGTLQPRANPPGL